MTLTIEELKEAIKAEAQRLGFFAIGFARAGKVSDDVACHLRRWLDEGGNADMAYMANWYEKRVDPRLLMPGLKTIVSVAMNYAPAHTIPAGEPQIAAYALGQDYHDVMKRKLHQLAAYIFGQGNSKFKIQNSKLIQSPLYAEGISNHKFQDSNLQSAASTPQPAASNPKDSVPSPQSPNYRVFVDSGPVLERYWAVQAGLGWIGKNHQLILPYAGSMFFLGELFLDFELPYDQPMASRCGRCHRCIDACPTGALIPNATPSPTGEGGEGPLFPSSLCLSYQTIENRGELSEAAQKAMGNVFYGCDRCQKACPWNRFATPNQMPELQPKPELLQMTEDKWEHLSVEEYRKLFKGSAVKRAKYEGLMRNIRAMEENKSVNISENEEKV